MFKQLLRAFRFTIFFTVLTGLLYPAVVTLLSQTLFPNQANGSIVLINGRAVGSGLLGQKFTRPEYFHGRPSAAGVNGYDGGSSGASNLGPTSRMLFNRVRAAADQFRKDNPDFQGLIPADTLTASASGLIHTSVPQQPRRKFPV
jgi:potassium-transporting ATPase KdpC subunit